jgi:hypothetical protein
MHFKRLLLLSVVSSLLLACSDGNGPSGVPTPEPEFLPIANPTVENPPEVGSIFVRASSFDLAEVDYEEAEYFLSGTANSFTNTNEFAADGLWQVETAEQADYRTRIIVYSPAAAENFSGTVVVEWLNVTAGFDTAAAWNAGHVEMIRSGDVWVGVSAQFDGVEGREGGFLPAYLKAVNPERYGSLSHPGDSFSYDIFSQVTEALRNPQGIDPLGGLVPERLIAYGQSQSAGRLVTHINALQLVYNPYDAYMVFSRGGRSSALSQAPQAEIPTPEASGVRVDVNVPVMTLQAETDILGLNYVEARQDDSEHFRLWEVAGTSHTDYYSLVAGVQDSVGEPRFAAVVEQDTIAGFLRCDAPFNAGPLHYVFASGVRKLADWVRSDQPPPSAPRLEVSADNSAFLLDELGNVRGGIRTPYVDVPPAVFTAIGEGEGFCFLFGTTALFSAAEMASLYVDETGYVQAVTEATNAAVAAGFLLQEDADAIIAWAPFQWQGQQSAP